MGEWQPIETAPTDGTHVLLAYYWAGERRHYIAEGWFDNRVIIDGWHRHGDSSVRATHWMPLPAPPASQTPEGK